MSILPNATQGLALMHSARALRGLHTIEELRAWLEEQRSEQRMRTTRSPLRSLRGWTLTPAPSRLEHASGRFFAVQGVQVETEFGAVRSWDQPIIDQADVGILGFLSKEFGGVVHVLVQAKIEPGNVNGVQVTTTVQATSSNCSRAHGGSRVPYLEHFSRGTASTAWLDVLQAEQGSRFYKKCNRNMIVPLEEDIDDGGRFAWATLGQVKELLLADNTVTMDARTVLACIARWTCGGPELARCSPGESAPTADRRGIQAGSKRARETAGVQAWLDATRERNRYAAHPCGLDALRDWRVGEWAVEHRAGRHFAVVGVEVETDSREVGRWCQPLISHPGMGLNGMLVRCVDGADQFLIRLHAYPGDREPFELSSTVSCSDVDERLRGPGRPPHLELFVSPPPQAVRHASIQSEEGGRFHHYQNRYVILEVPPDADIADSPYHRWMTLEEIDAWMARGLVGIEARNLLACLPVAGVPAAR